MKTKEFNYDLPKELIAQRPLTPRDASRLLVIDRHSSQLEHKQFNNLIDYLHPGDVLVANDSRVIPARIFGRKSTGGKVEILLLKRIDSNHWQALVGGRRLGENAAFELNNRQGKPAGIIGKITAVLKGPLREIRFTPSVDDLLDVLGHTPLPPYIHTRLENPERYQTIYSRLPGSAAAPTAGLHFSGDLLLAIRRKGILFETVTLHVGLDTFKPVEAEDVADHIIHSEWATLTAESARRINEAKLAGGRIIAVGTTAVRTLETASLHSAGLKGSFQNISARDAAGETSGSCPWKPVAAFEGATDLFIYPGYHFRAVDAMITNFHLPQSSLLMLVSAFSGQKLIQKAYTTAVQQKYRFFSFGDAMLIF